MGLFTHLDITQKALDATMMRQEMVTNNLANVDTPGYRRYDVNFETYLSKALERKGMGHVDLDKISPTIYQDYVNFTGRLDGNNVNIDVETAELSKTKIKYDTLIQRANAQIQRYKYILQNMR